MLDQNTDRMWYVIGAVIVGAALIFLVNSSFPQLFASVGDTFTNKTDETLSFINDELIPLETDGINQFDPNAAQANAMIYWIDGRIHTDNDYWAKGSIASAFIPVEQSDEYVVSIPNIKESLLKTTFRGGYYYNENKEYIGAIQAQSIHRVVVPNAGDEYQYAGPKTNTQDTPAYMRVTFKNIMTTTGKSFDELDIRIEKVLK